MPSSLTNLCFCLCCGTQECQHRNPLKHAISLHLWEIFPELFIALLTGNFITDCFRKNCCSSNNTFFTLQRKQLPTWKGQQRKKARKCTCNVWVSKNANKNDTNDLHLESSLQPSAEEITVNRGKCCQYPAFQKKISIVAVFFHWTTNHWLNSDSDSASILFLFARLRTTDASHLKSPLNSKKASYGELYIIFHAAKNTSKRTALLWKPYWRPSISAEFKQLGEGQNTYVKSASVANHYLHINMFCLKTQQTL